MEQKKGHWKEERRKEERKMMMKKKGRREEGGDLGARDPLLPPTQSYGGFTRLARKNPGGLRLSRAGHFCTLIEQCKLRCTVSTHQHHH
jgi:hypothetical protein